MNIYGLQKLSLLDYPEKLAATIFTGGCNLRCPFCHNASLVTHLSDSGKISDDEVISFLSNRIGKLDGVCITGGEPLLQNDLENFIREIRKLGYLIKLDTNGVLPNKLASLIDQGLIDYVAMDIKNSPDKYSVTVGIPDFNFKPVFESASILLQGRVPYEFRTTLVREFHTYEDIEKIGQLVKGAENYFLQRFEDSGDLVGFENSSAVPILSGFSEAETEKFENILAQYVVNVKRRN